LKLLLLTFVFVLSFAVQAQDQTPSVLKGPADWRFEKLPIPPGFAPDIKLKGFEEARFAPEMFDIASSNYFTYAIVVTVDGTAEIGTADLKDFLDRYYRGLSLAVGRRKQLKPDVSQIDAVVTPSKSQPDAKNKHDAKVPFFDTFNDGRKILLNMEISVTPKPDIKKTYIVLLISPQASNAAIWKKLHEIGNSLGLDGK
jgi:hypothetical protein